MAVSKIPPEAWAVAEALYPDGGAHAAQTALRALGHDVKPNTITAHMIQREISTSLVGVGDGWTEDDIAILREHAPRLSAQAIRARYLPDRTVHAVELAAYRYGVSMQKPSAGGRTVPMLKLGPWDDAETRVVFLGDQQVPDQDEAAHRCALDFLRYYLGRWQGRKYLFTLGDTLNATPLGRFPHSPDVPDMREEIAQAKRLLRDYGKAAGAGTEFIYVEGNHEYRATKKIEHDPSLVGMVAPWWQLFDLNDVWGIGRWQFIPYMAGFVELPGRFLACHGYRVSQHSAFAAKLQMENTGMSGVSGHTHRLGVHHKMLYDRTLRWYENGCLCRPADYLPGVANWSLGFTYGRWFGEQYVLNQVEIIDGRAYAEGRWFGADNRPPDGR